MLLAKVRKMSHHIVGPLVLLWLLCQSMVLCAGLLGGNSSTHAEHNNHSTGSGISTMLMMAGEHHDLSDHVFSDQGHQASHGSDQQSKGQASTNMAASDCCDEQESYLSNSFFSSIVFLLFFPLYWLIVSLRQRLKHSTYHREPPPLYNYPRNHVFNCTFLN